MKRKPAKKTRPMRVIRLWTLPQAEKALPYVRSVTASLREQWVEMQGHKQKLRHLSSRPGRPDRSGIIAHEEAVHDQTEAEDRFSTTLKELMDIDVYLLDPAQGVTLIPFNQENELAWYVFDLFGEDGIKTWRFHKDPVETRRPMSELKGDTPAIAGEAV